MQSLPKAFWVKTRLNTVLFFLIIWIIIFQHLVEDFRNDLIQILPQYVTSGSWIECSLVTCLLKPKAVSFITEDRSSEADKKLCSAFPCWECLSHVSSDLSYPFSLPEPLIPNVCHYAYSVTLYWNIYFIRSLLRFTHFVYRHHSAEFKQSWF